MSPLVKKSSGRLEDFDENKLKKSLRFAGANEKQIRHIIQEITPLLFEGITSNKIFNMAFKRLKKMSYSISINYSLKKAIFELGPSGFHFEKFVAELMKSKGYKVQVGIHKKGRCIKHEIDVVGTRPDQTVYVECKFHNSPSRKNDVKTALYIHARCMDLKENLDNDFNEFWLVSNTSFTKDAMTYAQCVGIKLIGINCPEEGNIQDLVNKYHLHPITSLQRLKKKHQTILMDKDIILAKEIYNKKELLTDLGLSDAQIKGVFLEIERLKQTHG